jgi:hypothetical protein
MHVCELALAVMPVELPGSPEPIRGQNERKYALFSEFSSL